VEVDIKDYDRKARHYCERCGGLSAAFITSYGNEITCADGTHLEQRWAKIPAALVLGECKP